MTTIVFETATLADSLKRASQVAPTKGQSLATTAGLVFKIDPSGENPVTVLASDGTIFYTEAISIVESSGEPVTWRLPSVALAAIVSNLPMRSGSTVKLEDRSGKESVFLQAGRTKVKLAQIDPSGYPTWEPFQSDKYTMIPSIGKLIARTRWASADSSGTLKSVFITSDGLYSTDRFKIARYLIQTGMQETVIIPNDQLSKILPRDGDVKVGSSGNVFILYPDEFTQIATSVYNESEFPVGRVLDADFKYETNFSKQEMLSALNRALAFDSNNRQSIITLVIGKGEIAIVTTDKEIGLFGEQIDASGSALEHSPMVRMQVGPVTFRNMLLSLTSDSVKMFYNNPEESPRVLVLRDGAYSCALALSKRDERREDDNQDR